jgi:putative transcriptional regulator
MKDELFEELKKSIKQGGQILKGKKKPGRIFNFDNPDPKQIRDKLGLSQNKFAKLLGISISTLQNWEQGRRKPEGPAKVLLKVASKYPDAVLNTVYNLHQ